MHMMLKLLEEERTWFDQREADALAKNGNLSTTALALSTGARFALQRLEHRVRMELMKSGGSDESR